MDDGLSVKTAAPPEAGPKKIVLARLNTKPREKN